MKSISCTIFYGKTKIDYELLIMRRKTLEIAVHPDKNIVIKAPASSTIEAIEAIIKKKARWIKRQISYFNQFDPRTPPRKYVGGESHLYLGRQYRLKIIPADNNNVILKNGYFFIETTKKMPNHISKLLDLWYKEHAQIHLSRVFDDCWETFKKKGINKPNLKIRMMRSRWGSLSNKGQLTLNLNLIRSPKECIEYVVIHELCHLIHHNHGSEFYKLLDRTMPDWMKRKHKLETTLA